MQWATLFISLVALGASLFSLYTSWLAPFNLKINPGNPLIGKSPIAGIEKTFATTPVIPIEFKNVGARDGAVKALLILVKSGNKKWLLRPQSFCEEFGTTAYHEKEREAFHPFSLAGKERITKNILFNPFGHKRYPFPKFMTEEDIPLENMWSFEYYVLDSEGSNYRLAYKQNFRLTRTDIWNKQFIPEEESVIKTSEKFVEDLTGNN